MLQPKNLKKQKTTIYKNFNLWDLVVFLMTLLISALIGFTIISKDNQNYTTYSTLIFISITILFLPLFINVKKHSARLWLVLVRLIKFILSNNKYTSSSKVANTKSLIRIKEIKNNIVYLSSSQLYKVYKFTGYDVVNRPENEKENFINHFLQILDQTPFFITFIKRTEPTDYNHILEDISKNIKKPGMSKDYKEYQFASQKDFTALSEKEFRDCYYVIIYASSVQQLNDYEGELLHNLNSLNLNPCELNSLELLYFHKTIYSPFDAVPDQNKFENKDLIKNPHEYLAPNNLTINNTHIKYNNHYFSIQTIDEYALDIPYYWIQDLFNTESTVIWNIHQIPSENYAKLIDKSALNAETNMVLDNKSSYRTRKAQLELEAIEETSDLTLSQGQKLFNTSFYFISYGATPQNLKEMEKQNKRNIATLKSNLNHLVFKQFDGLNMITFTPSFHSKNQTEMVSRNLAYGWPFINEEYDDKNNFIWAMRNANPILLNIWKRNNNHINSNCVFFGLSGSGKTTAMKKLMLNSYYNDKASIIVIDPQREYGDLTELTNASWIDLGTGKTALNPLQINMAIRDDNTNETTLTNEVLLSNQINKIIEWFKILNPELNQDSQYLIITALKSLYGSKKYNFYNLNKDISKLENNEYPRITELIETIIDMKFNKSEAPIYEPERIRLKNYLTVNFLNNGIYAKTYNNYTNIDLNKDFIIIDTKVLTDNKSTTALNLAFYQLLNYIQTKINYNFYTSKLKTMLIVDEAHYFVDKNNMATLDFLFQTTKTIRKYNGSITLTTQNPADFALSQDLINKTNAILKNIQYNFIFKQTGDDIRHINRLYNPSNKVEDDNEFITAPEQEYLLRAHKGQLLFSSATGYKIRCKMNYNDFERKIIFKDKETLND
ncbi:Mbov_0397 family ICE element conjugal transfer ATPase [Mycoplasma crocodyli]|uniref:TraE/TrsE-like membrane protein n=1 Tax=Mycoplasma crocodyli (strain ATCC 51981 / MP145) TaxID=512564 RepID=D5E5P8_MYCCM|nr:DUF87 domain-containing protein [Mycoplasma crocodyli]ADE19749.1 TraE/TrsE-like membrane protein [Mycoplasma crocodyli MP145]